MKKFFATLLLCLVAMQSWAAFVGDRTDFRDETIYFVMTTRFYDGDKSNNTYCWDGAKDAGNQDPNWRGDFKGLIEKLDYIKALGFTAVWVTPIVQNGSGFDYHGYHAMDFSKVDKRYESEDCNFQDLIDAAHARGMKVILDIVLNHTGNFGEGNLCKLFDRDYSKPQSDLSQCMIPFTKKNGGKLQDNYNNLPGGQQYSDRLTKMKNTDNQNHDNHNLWHHYGNFNWDEPNRWWAQIAGDCVDLNTENPQTYNYLIDCYGSFIKMGVDGFRIDTGGHISRLTFNTTFVPAFQALGEQYKHKRLNGCPFYMYAEVCARFQGSVTYRDQPALSPYFYTWQSPAALRSQWNNDGTYWDKLAIYESTDPATLDNQKLCLQEAATSGGSSSQPKSNNAWLDGNNYHKPDYSQASGLNIIDFPVHYGFNSVGNIWGLFGSDNYYNDATYNVVYVDSHDYCPGPNDGVRFNGGTEQWAENMSFMFTFRGIPCVYYGSEIEFRKGQIIDKGPEMALSETGRAYYGGYLTGDLEVSDFGQVKSASGNVKATLSYPLARHLQRLNQIRAAVPALRKGQYSTSGCSGNGYAYKRRYTDDKVDSYVLVALNGGATFTGVLNGTYTDAVTGNTITVTNGTLNTGSFSGKGNMRIYVLNGPGKIGEDEPFLYGNTKPSSSVLSWDGHEEDGDPDTKYITGGGGDDPVDPIDLDPYTPIVNEDDYSVFYEAPLTANTITTWVWGDAGNYTGGSWPGQKMELMGTNADKTRKIFKWTYDGPLTTVPANIIFVVDGNQTADLTYKNHGYYISGNYDHEVTNYESPAPTLTIDKASGHYEDQVEVTIKASDANATIVYTTDGTRPTADSKTATGQLKLTFTKNTVLTAGVLFEGAVRSVISREYIFDGFKPYTATIYLKDPTTEPNNWSNVYFYAWAGSNTQLLGGWPGEKQTATKVINGDTFYYHTFDIATDGYTFNIIFNKGDNSGQTIDITGLNKDTYFEISSLTNKFTVKDITDQYASIPGDVNGDGITDITDVNTIINIILGGDSASNYGGRADVNGDGVVDITDVNATINIILK